MTTISFSASAPHTRARTTTWSIPTDPMAGDGTNMASLLPFGRDTQGTSERSPSFGARVGYCWDAGPYYYIRARHFNVHLGRWLSRDPGRFDDGPNLYLYVGNNPV